MNRKLLLLSTVAAAAFGAVASARADYASTVSGLGPILYYRMGTTNLVPSEIAATNTGTLGAAFNGEYQALSLSRGLAGAIAGDPDTCVSVNGAVGQQIVVPYSAQYNPAGPFSVEFWAKPAAGSSASGNHTVAISMVNGQNPSNANDRSGWCVRHVGADWQFVLGFDHSDGATFYSTTLAASGTVVEEAWQHVVAVYTDSLVSIYVNGVAVASEAPALPVMPNTAAPLIIGDRGYTGWDFNGLVDELAIYTTALTGAEIQAHYNNGITASRAVPYATLIQQKSPALYYRLDEPSLTLPLEPNTGSLGSVADASCFAGTTPGVAGPHQPAVTGFETTNRAVSFSGLSGLVNIPAQALNLDSATWTCWIKRNGDQPKRAGIMHNRGANTKATGLGFQDAGNALSYNWEDAGSDYNFNPNFVPPDQEWTFVAVTVTPDNAVMYMGTAAGLVAATNTLSHPTHDFSGAPMEIGRDNYEATRLFKGAMDEFAMFDKALDYDQVSNLFNAALPALLLASRSPTDPIYEGMKVTFTAAGRGKGTVTYQWRKDGTPLAGATASTLVLTEATAADSGNYDVVLTDKATTTTTLTSDLLPLTVQAGPPQILQTPKSSTLYVNGTATFSVQSVGSHPITYQWKHGATAIPGATDSTLLISDAQIADAGDYTATVTNPHGSVDLTVTLTVLPVPANFAAAAMELHPIGFWRLNETSGTTASDYVNGRDGTYGSGVVSTNGPQPTAFKGFEAANTAFHFNGGSDSVAIPALNLYQATITIAAWVKPEGVPADYACLVFSRDGNTIAGLNCRTQGEVGYHWNDSDRTYNFQSGLTLEPDQWNFVALVVQPSQATVYLDSGTGLNSSVNTQVHTMEEFNGKIAIGGQAPAAGRVFQGAIDDVVIYDRALTAAEITSLRQAGVAGYAGAVAPRIVQAPEAQTVQVGASHTLSVKAAGSVPLTYQWQHNGTDIAGATHSSLVIPSASTGDAGTYRVTVSNSVKSISTDPVTLAVLPAPAFINLTNALVLHLTFDGTVADSSGRGNNGSMVGEPGYVSGKLGQGLHYNTDNSDTANVIYNYVTLGSPADLQFGDSQAFSVAYWIRYTGAGVDLPVLSNNDCGEGCVGFFVGPAAYVAGTWSWSFEASGYFGIDIDGPLNAINDGSWHNVVHTFDRAGWAVTYLDGAMVDTKALAASFTESLDTGNPMNVGQVGTANYGVNFGADIDDLGVWRRVLNEYEAEAIYQVGQAGRSFDSVGPASVTMTVQKQGADVVLSWFSGTLESSSTVNGGYTAVTGATAPSYRVTPAGGAKFYRVKL